VVTICEHLISAVTLTVPQFVHREYVWVLHVYQRKQLPVRISINNCNILVLLLEVYCACYLCQIAAAWFYITGLKFGLHRVNKRFIYRRSLMHSVCLTVMSELKCRLRLIASGNI
jgi:hypothetical protein